MWRMSTSLVGVCVCKWRMGTHIHDGMYGVLCAVSVVIAWCMRWCEYGEARYAVSVGYDSGDLYAWPKLCIGGVPSYEKYGQIKYYIRF